MVKRYGVPILRVYMVVLHVDKVFWGGWGGGGFQPKIIDIFCYFSINMLWYSLGSVANTLLISFHGKIRKIFI